MASFQDKIGWKAQRKRENKNCRFVLFRSYPTRNRKFKKIAKKFKKLKKYHYCLISNQNRLEEAEKEWKEKLLFRFVPARCVIENSKKIVKKFKKLKNTIMNSFQTKIGWKKMRKREIKIIVPFRSVPTRGIIENYKQIAKKLKKLKKYHCGFISSEDWQEKAVKERK